ncbi:MAG: 2-C-methyl-D-erythritol 4-phosphate cytidylyltransferase [Planctomycetota bacterium]
MRIAAIIPAAGTGTRLGLGVPKAFVEVMGRPILFHTLDALRGGAPIGRWIICVPPEHREELVRRYGGELGALPAEVIEGGPTRMQSVAKALARVEESWEFVLVHDAVRPLVAPEVVRKTVDAAQRTGAAIAAAPASDTVKESDDDRRVVRTLPRERLWLVQTPQVFRRALLARAYDEALRLDLEATDDSVLVEHLGAPVEIVPSDASNFKITTPADLEIFKLRAGTTAD